METYGSIKCLAISIVHMNTDNASCSEVVFHFRFGEKCVPLHFWLIVPVHFNTLQVLNQCTWGVTRCYPSGWEHRNRLVSQNMPPLISESRISHPSLHIFVTATWRLNVKWAYHAKSSLLLRARCFRPKRAWKLTGIRSESQFLCLSAAPPQTFRLRCVTKLRHRCLLRCTNMSLALETEQNVPDPLLFSRVLSVTGILVGIRSQLVKKINSLGHINSESHLQGMSFTWEDEFYLDQGGRELRWDY